MIVRRNGRPEISLAIYESPVHLQQRRQEYGGEKDSCLLINGIGNWMAQCKKINNCLTVHRN